MRALVIHTRRTGLGVIRSLGKMGVEVYAADEYQAPGFYSRYVRGTLVFTPVVKSGEKAFIDRLMRFGESFSGEEKPVLFTASDDYLVIIARNWEKLSRCFLSASETDEKVLRDNLLKDRMYPVAEAAGVAYPKTYYSSNFSVDDVRYPVIVKPSLRKSSDKDVGSQVFKVRKCNDQDELERAAELLNQEQSDFVVQEFIEGGDQSLYTVGLFSDKGRVVAAATARKLRQFPAVTGECSFGELVYEPSLIKAAEAFVKQTGVTGICQVEFKEADGKFYLMEINPRPWSWNSLMEYAGVNLPYLACRSAYGKCGEETLEQQRFRGTWIFALMDFKYHVLQNQSISLWRFLRQLVQAKRHAYWDWKDPVPFFAAVFHFLRSPKAAYRGRSVE